MSSAHLNYPNAARVAYNKGVITKKRLEAYRRETYRYELRDILRSKEEAIEFVNTRGFIYFWPIKGITLPSLWSAVAGDRQVADAHDDPGHVTWSWKDDLLGKDAWYYAKVLRKKATMIAFDVASYFYALSENYGAPEEDYLTIYEQGRMTQEAKVVYEAILDEGPIDTVALRRATHMTSKSSDSRFARALEYLQSDFKIAPVAVTQAGAWRYAFAYDVVARHYPHIPEAARFIPEDQARQKLTELYFRSVGAAQMRDLKLLFQWQRVEIERAVNTLAQTGIMLVCIGLGWLLITVFSRVITAQFVWWPLIPGGILAVVGWGLYIGGNPNNALSFIGNTGSIALILFGIYLILLRRGIR